MPSRRTAATVSTEPTSFFRRNSNVALSASAARSTSRLLARRKRSRHNSSPPNDSSISAPCSTQPFARRRCSRSRNDSRSSVLRAGYISLAVSQRRRQSFGASPATLLQTLEQPLVTRSDQAAASRSRPGIGSGYRLHRYRLHRQTWDSTCSIPSCSCIQHQASSSWKIQLQASSSWKGAPLEGSLRKWTACTASQQARTWVLW